MFEKHLWKSDILSKDADHRPGSLLKMSLFHRCSYITRILVKNSLKLTLKSHSPLVIGGLEFSCELTKLTKGECTKVLLERYETQLNDLYTEPVTYNTR